ncbi:MAG: hypothetical protein ABI665_04540 [Vicinamibacterales bacterium]
MATVAGEAIDRRRTHRLAPGGTPWRPDAVLRPGQPVVLVNISTHGALVESPTRLRPGARTELQLVGAAARCSVRGRLDRCHVARLEPLCYRGAMVFDERLELDVVPGDE